jgi:FtsH-binding integral membrane protein
VIVVACTLYAAYTESDFTTSYGIIIVLTAAMLVLFIVTMFTSSPFIHNLYCCIGVVLFGIYLIIDTQMILGGRTVELAVDEYFLAAMLLYIDVIQIFLYILELLGSNKD